MGLFTTLKRMAKGEPVFQSGDQAGGSDEKGWKNANGEASSYQQPTRQQEHDDYNPEKHGDDAYRQHVEGGRSAQPAGPAIYDANGRKILPVVTIKRLEFSQNGTTIRYDFEIHNESDRRLELDKIVMFQRNHELDRWMNPGEGREIEVYSGPAHPQKPDDKVQVHYKDERGDYFMAQFWVDFMQHDGYYVIHQVHNDGQIRDI